VDQSLFLHVDSEKKVLGSLKFGLDGITKCWCL